ncbi:histidine ammonia-lyase [Vibrio sp. V31_P5A7T61]|uniref:histidine ammonia-lyase n=1 Tax=unclassified Vibrio TaxID=2614977 RepID=UPI0013736B38|nr:MULTISPECIES: histidine ammonia-lyase [unclassified Vibrio]EKO3893454.1 histidine ammonia-lyase [Vibrio metschnikovii]NAW63188.1 histidine ammonia-lyase [Vibrio sp. V31_P5A7T61]NAX01505.1 histidine ammonia-lyase [Vibrio sp. V34_P3A8T189]NAX07314.1 histidine ammonia-lyase [Vibrio sp. V40_P2S30T141]NAX63489.1 histidine ammonia-lyase [Vibrio sp. V32_P6A28T40]
MHHLTITPGEMTLSQLRHINSSPVCLSLDPSAIPAIEQSTKVVEQVITEGRTVYGINTGFGLLANTKIAPEDLETLQKSIVLSHAAGIGAWMDDDTVRLMMVLKINSLARGFSGIRLSVIEALITLVNHQVYPCVPQKGSVGASGDLAPLAHMSTVLLGEGQARYQGEIIDGAQALRIAGLSPITLAPKEGLALLNGTQASTAFALQGLFMAEDLFASAIVCGAMSVEAALGSRKPFDPRIHRVRGHRTQMDAAAAYRHLLDSRSEIGDSHSGCEKVQDPYSLRCQPQVMGACLQQIRQTAEVLCVEANAVSDNPLVFADDGDIISGGNFHAEPVAMAADNLALAIAEIGSLSERRMALLIDSALSKLPPFLVDNGGVNSGFMIAQVTAAALASENKTYAHPASIDSLPTSANQEDHVSMATFAARRLRDMAENTRGILAVEYLSAAQGLDFRAPHRSSERIELAKQMLRAKVSFYDKDRYFAPDIQQANELLKQAVHNALMPEGLLPSITHHVTM